MKKSRLEHLGRRERQIMDVIYRRGRATAAEVLDGLPDPPSYSAVRAMLRILEQKGHIRHEQDGPRYVFTPVVTPAKARRSMLQHVVNTFFQGSTGQAVASLLEASENPLSGEELERLSRLIDAARKQGR